jgi:UDP-GlcNAc:undecaprenyl-phosphate GlcNAc-1-phosphate transferase
MPEYIWMAGKAFLIAVILTPIIRDISRSFNLVDRPGQRKVHAYPMPRVGGIAIAIAYGVSLITFSHSSPQMTAALEPAWKLIPGAALVFLVGLLDDFFSLKPWLKILGLVAAASVVFFSGLRVGGLARQEVAVWLDYPLTVFWLLLTSNALNLIDGLDGLCAGMGLVATLALFAAALLHGNYPLAYVTFPLAGALVGFLCYNINPATVFLGDSGALLIGFLLGCYGMVWTEKASALLSMLVPLLALSIPLLDVSLSVLRRFLRNQPIFGADRGHIHHRLLDRGLSARKAMLVLCLFAALAATLALLGTSLLSGKYQGFIILLFCAAAWAGIQQLRYSEFDIAGRLLFRGEFHRTVHGRLQLQSLAALLEQAASSEQWWRALQDGLRGLELASLRWIRPEEVREERRPGAVAAWSFHVSLTDKDAIELDGSAEMEGSSFDFVDFARLAARTYPAKKAQEQSPSPSGIAAVLP